MTMKTKKISLPAHYYDFLAFGDSSGIDSDLIAEIESFKTLHKIVKFKQICFDDESTGFEFSGNFTGIFIVNQ